MNAFAVEGEAFEDWMDAVRAGNEDAATELVRYYEPTIRRAMQARLLRYRLNRFLDAADISQIVLANFFKRVVTGRFVLNEPDQILRLLLTMARKQVANERRRYMAIRRDSRRVDELFSEHSLNSLVDSGPSPCVIAAVNELLQEMHRRFAPSESYLAEQRLLGRSWVEMAAEMGGSPEALRKKFERALDRIARQFDLYPG